MPAVQVLLPGLGSTMSEWTPQFLQLLAHRREVIILDYMGQGLTQARLCNYEGRPLSAHPVWHRS